VRKSELIDDCSAAELKGTNRGEENEKPSDPSVVVRVQSPIRKVQSSVPSMEPGRVPGTSAVGLQATSFDGGSWQVGPGCLVWSIWMVCLV
jgi:hypothetical protein